MQTLQVLYRLLFTPLAVSSCLSGNSVINIFATIMVWIENRPLPGQLTIDESHRNRPHEIAIPAIFFDGASADGFTGCGVWIKTAQKDRTHIFWNGGRDPTTKPKLWPCGVLSWLLLTSNYRMLIYTVILSW